jgi:uncharacterized membrane protein YoaK (UPF0700 family)
VIRYGRSARLFAASLSALAGFVDAIAFLALGGFFVSFMSGNSTRLGVGAAAGLADALTAGGLIAAFVAGVAAGTLAGRRFDGHRAAAVLTLVAALLAVAAFAGAAGWIGAAAAAMALAMGAENAIFERNGEVRIGLTYMTGTLVRAGQGIASALSGGERFGWAPHLLLWLGLVAGATAGAAAFASFGLQALWAATAAASTLAAIAAGPAMRARLHD